MDYFYFLALAARTIRSVEFFDSTLRIVAAAAAYYCCDIALASVSLVSVEEDHREVSGYYDMLW